MSRRRYAAPSERSQGDFALDVLLGLTAERKSLPSKYLYDDEGSRLFERIEELPEYYPTRCEAEILDRAAGKLAAALAPGPLTVVELGSGDGRKTKALLRRFEALGLHPRYHPVDISESAMEELTSSVNCDLRGVPCRGEVCDYFDALRRLGRSREPSARLVLFLGSTIGNLEPEERRRFLRTLWGSLRCGDKVLIGFDLKKDIKVLLRAYDDPRGVTREFNLNLLRRINRELGGEFDTNAFRHYAAYEPFSGAVETFLISLRRQAVRVAALSKTFLFEPFEPVRTERSYKFAAEELDALAREAGFRSVALLLDSRRLFADALWEADKPS